jgi:hypothetical protein
MHPQPTLKDEILRGIKDIAEFIGEKPRRVFYLAEAGLLPLTKEGSTWVGLKAALTAHYQRAAERAAEEAAKRRETYLANNKAKNLASDKAKSTPSRNRKRRRAVNTASVQQALT